MSLLRSERVNLAFCALLTDSAAGRGGKTQFEFGHQCHIMVDAVLEAFREWDSPAGGKKLTMSPEREVLTKCKSVMSPNHFKGSLPDCRVLSLI